MDACGTRLTRRNVPAHGRRGYDGSERDSDDRKSRSLRPPRAPCLFAPQCGGAAVAVFVRAKSVLPSGKLRG